MTELTTQHILVTHHAVQILTQGPGSQAAPREALVTLMGNISYYGYALSEAALTALSTLPMAQLHAWWLEVEAVLGKLTGANLNMGEFVVYKNFPSEVLVMSEVDYWCRQILMYWGLPVELFRAEPEVRAARAERPTLRVLHLADASRVAQIMAELMRLPVRWVDAQWAAVEALSLRITAPLELSEVAFKENMVRLAVHLMAHGRDAHVTTATDALRLAVGLSGGDLSLRTPCKLRAFRRAERRFLLANLEHATYLEADLAARPEPFKRLMRALRPGDYAARFPRVVAAYSALYEGTLAPTYASRVERALRDADLEALPLLAQRPGEFARRLRHTLLVFGLPAAEAFGRVLPALTTAQLLKLQRFFRQDATRRYRLFPPRGAWSRLRVFRDGVAIHQSRKRPYGKPVIKTLPERRALTADERGAVCAGIARELKGRLARQLPAVELDARLERVKLQTSDSALTSYGRGTRFVIPPELTFVRTAVYWKAGPGRPVVWYDNGWNLFSARWEAKGTCCWNSPRPLKGAVFSGDPVSSGELEGRACQLIDLDLNLLEQQGVRYAVWSVLCYSKLTFDEVEEVFAALLWGVDAQSGGLFEPSRCQLAMPVKGPNYTKYVAMLDLKTREVVYLDANLASQVGSARLNEATLSALMPAMQEYMSSLPSVHDLFEHAPQRPGGLPVRYDDEAQAPRDGEPAYIFRPQRTESAYSPLDLSALLSARGDDADRHTDGHI